jgi:uncharacterized membrane protein
MADTHASPEHAPEPASDTDIQPFVLPARKLDAGAPLRWLALGWRDLRQACRLSLTYGAALVLFGYLMTWAAWDEGHVLLLFTLGSAFILAGPILAFGLYSISNQLQRGLVPRFGYCILVQRKHLRNELLFALVILVVLLVWARAASMVHVFFPMGEDMGVTAWLEFLAVGSTVGAFFATLVFTISAFSLPLMLDRGTDAVTGALTSIAAVLHNKLVMLLWALLIVGLVLVGFATAYIGLAIVLPWIGHATWHAYRDTIPHPEGEPLDIEHPA